MKIAFFDPAAEQVTPQTKGAVLEAFTRRLARACGYSELVLRAKHSSLEYDVEGRHVVSRHLLQGESKAHDAKITGKELTAFIGKVLPFGQKQRADALFISTSDLTPDGRDYLDTHYPDGWVIPRQLFLKTLVGLEIPHFLSDQGELIRAEAVEASVRDRHGLEVQDTWLMLGDKDDFIVALCGDNLVSAPQGFLTLSRHGGALQLPAQALERLRSQLPDLGALPDIEGGEVPSPAGQRALPSIAAGKGWFDYRFPVDPQYFVGRQQAIVGVADIVQAIRKGETASRAIQVVSRSGVGKSSLLLKLPETLADVVSVLVDGRSLRTSTDLRLLGAQTVERVNRELGSSIPLPRSSEAVIDALTGLSKEAVRRGRVVLIGVDQFESTFNIPDVFNALSEAVAITTTEALNIIWVFARKTDLAVNPDAMAGLSLDQLNQFSRTVVLTDFHPDEGAELLAHIEGELGEPLLVELADAVSIFSGGFPWLHKRLCAHILDMHRAGINQRVLLAGGLRAEDLFEEDLEALDEHERALLRTLAAHLPATAHDLARRLEGEVSSQHLTRKLNDFLGLRLLRLSGDVYDTYNDVFKTYLITGIVPFKSRYVFRSPPQAAMALLRTAADLGPMEIGEFSAQVGGNKVAIQNKLRELRLLGLLDTVRGTVALTQEAREAVSDGTLGDLLRDRIRSNGLVMAVLSRLAGQDELGRDEVIAILRAEMPSVQVSEETWGTYATLLGSWMDYAQVAHRVGEALRPRDLPTSAGLQTKAFHRGVFRQEVFVPSVRPKKVLDLMNAVADSPLGKAELYKVLGVRVTAGTIRDASALDLVREENGLFFLGRTGKTLFAGGSTPNETSVARLCLSKPNIKKLLDEATTAPLTRAQQREVLETFGSTDWSDSTWAWRLGVLTTWLTKSGQAKSGRKGLRGV